MLWLDSRTDRSSHHVMKLSCDAFLRLLTSIAHTIPAHSQAGRPRRPMSNPTTLLSVYATLPVNPRTRPVSGWANPNCATQIHGRAPRSTPITSRPCASPQRHRTLAAHRKHHPVLRHIAVAAGRRRLAGQLDCSSSGPAVTAENLFCGTCVTADLNNWMHRASRRRRRSSCVAASYAHANSLSAPGKKLAGEDSLSTYRKYRMMPVASCTLRTSSPIPARSRLDFAADPQLGRRPSASARRWCARRFCREARDRQLVDTEKTICGGASQALPESQSRW
ncbi:hypothetical protein OH76DRAFT_1184130 [Lentinus brumalis]|uniref:Uncharacterized protein n=1 Tax=Lentinus brumalis TaxID=2498619 RepID=A0A371CU05_9APHY|nr:hypothetical protein OH76DRAFT_1184130 [Polyporus brumalis]